VAVGSAQRQLVVPPEAGLPPASWLGGTDAAATARRAALASGAGDLASWRGEGGPGLVVVDQASVPAAELEAALATLGARAVVVVDPEAPRQVALALLGRFGLEHLIGGNGDALGRELALVQRFRARREGHGLASYFAPGTRLESRVVLSAASVQGTVEELLARLDFSASFASVREFLRLTANELATNAVYHAPVDAAARPKFTSVDRREKVALAEAERVVVTMAADETQVGVAVLDRFGRLERETVARHVAKAPEGQAFLEDEGRGGAGVGLCLTYHSSSQLAFHVERGRRCEAVCLLERSKRFRDYKARVPSLHWFETR
jgi:hypothetical protein